ncbi:MAG: hypothetical protein GY861_03970 [bacterium]|nr:hypothetical protein [bacterium]
MKIEESKKKALKILDAMKGESDIEISCDDEGSGWLDIDGVTFYFDSEKNITESVVPL